MDCCGSIWSERLQFAKTSSQAGSVELVDGKDTDAALGTSGAAREPISSTAGRVGQGGIDDLNEFVVATRGEAVRHVSGYRTGNAW
jgi:hypothetical protein